MNSVTFKTRDNYSNDIQQIEESPLGTTDSDVVHDLAEKRIIFLPIYFMLTGLRTRKQREHLQAATHFPVN